MEKMRRISLQSFRTASFRDCIFLCLSQWDEHFALLCQGGQEKYLNLGNADRLPSMTWDLLAWQFLSHIWLLGNWKSTFKMWHMASLVFQNLATIILCQVSCLSLYKYSNKFFQPLLPDFERSQMTEFQIFKVPSKPQKSNLQ